MIIMKIRGTIVRCHVAWQRQVSGFVHLGFFLRMMRKKNWNKLRTQANGRLRRRRILTMAKHAISGVPDIIQIIPQQVIQTYYLRQCGEEKRCHWICTKWKRPKSKTHTHTHTGPTWTKIRTRKKKCHPSEPKSIWMLLYTGIRRNAQGNQISVYSLYIELLSFVVLAHGRPIAHIHSKWYKAITSE